MSALLRRVERKLLVSAYIFLSSQTITKLPEVQRPSIYCAGTGTPAPEVKGATFESTAPPLFMVGCICIGMGCIGAIVLAGAGMLTGTCAGACCVYIATGAAFAGAGR